MKLTEDYEDNQKLSPSVLFAVFITSVFVVALLIVVIMTNNKKEDSNRTSRTEEISIQNTETPGNISVGSLHPEDLDFWDKYPEKVEPVERSEEIISPSDIFADPAEDGRHTLVKYSDGSQEWVLINPYLTKHDFDFTNLVCQSGIMKYYDNNRKISYAGIDVSEKQDYIDFVKVKKAGIQFVMIRVGARGYGSGNLSLDEYLNENLKRASDAGLNIGLYFSSQAISKDEAIEEANLVLGSLGEYKITYPIAFVMERISNDKARTDDLSKSKRTNIAKAFMDTVIGKGYKTAIYGDKEFLIADVDLTKLTDYDVWYAEDADMPDYPYRFTMWQYNCDGYIDGISGTVNLNVSMIDYSEK